MLHQIVAELSEAQVEAMLPRLVRERYAVENWIEGEELGADENFWAVANAREAIRGEGW